MSRTPVAKLKASLSEFLSKVKKGQEVIVTDRGHPVARLIPFTRGGPSGSERERLIREGIIQPGKTGRFPMKLLKGSKVKDPQGLLLKALLEEREEGR